jgi:hypothetical protein
MVQNYYGGWPQNYTLAPRKGVILTVKGSVLGSRTKGQGDRSIFPLDCGRRTAANHN